MATSTPTQSTTPVLIRYSPDIAGNALYLALFTILVIGQVYQGARFKTWSFLACMAAGLVLEVIGYAGRLRLHNDPSNFTVFMQYLIPLTIAPAFVTAAIYLSLTRIITIYGAAISRLKPATYVKIFVSCDILCLFLQAAGGAVTATADSDQDGLRTTGFRIMIAGLAAQVVCLAVFMALAGEFYWRVRGEQRQTGPGVVRCSRAGAFGGFEWKWRGFQWGLAIATVLIFIRSIFRVAELSDGFDSDLANDEVSFMILEGAMMVVACGGMTLFHPGVCLGGYWRVLNATPGKERRDREIALGGGGEEDGLQCDALVGRDRGSPV